MALLAYFAAVLIFACLDDDAAAAMNVPSGFVIIVILMYAKALVVFSWSSEGVVSFLQCVGEDGISISLMAHYYGSSLDLELFKCMRLREVGTMCVTVIYNLELYSDVMEMPVVLLES